MKIWLIQTKTETDIKFVFTFDYIWIKWILGSLTRYKEILW